MKIWKKKIILEKYWNFERKGAFGNTLALVLVKHCYIARTRPRAFPNAPTIPKLKKIQILKFTLSAKKIVTWNLFLFLFSTGLNPVASTEFCPVAFTRCKISKFERKIQFGKLFKFWNFGCIWNYFSSNSSQALLYSEN